MKDKQPKLSVGCRVNRNSSLMDFRLGRMGDFFGTVDNVARQYGIEIEDKEGYLIFTAPKSRLQMFVEKLHFSGHPYFPIE